MSSFEKWLDKTYEDISAYPIEINELKDYMKDKVVLSRSEYELLIEIADNSWKIDDCRYGCIEAYEAIKNKNK